VGYAVNGAGDPASLAATATALQRVARDLVDAADSLDSRPAPGAPRRSPANRRLLAELADVCRAAAAVTRTGGDELNRAAYSQARLGHQSAALADEAAAAGLVTGPTGYAMRPGIVGVADPADSATRSAHLAGVRDRAAQLEQHMVREREQLIARLSAAAADAEALAGGLR